MELKTPLYDRHVEAGGKIVPFGGYSLPVQYTSGVIAEHMAVREKAGLFDVSHMGELLLKGPDALENLNRIFANDFTSLKDGRVRYTPLCNENGGVVDDLIVCRFNQNEYYLVVNASNRHKDYAFIKKNLKGDAELTDLSDNTALLALQGPKAHDILKKLMDESSIPMQYYSFIRDVDVAGVNCLISQTGYTGEMGWELYCAPEDAVKLWDAILNAGEEYGLLRCGLGARDTLRLEAGMPLYGHEMTDEITPIEAGLDFAVKMKKPDFIGKSALEAPPSRRRVGLKMTGRGIAREDSDVYLGDKKVGVTTSGSMMPYLGYAVAMALMDADCTEIGTALEVDVRGRRVACEIVPMPFYSRPKE